MENLEKLTRDQMKNVRGGKLVSCPVTLAPGYGFVGSSHSYDCTGETPDQCQAGADAWCWSQPGCANVDCPGAA